MQSIAFRNTQASLEEGS
ncbi:BgTH12-05407 [Blumeria graminis f. sp. triticale]|uniref:BgTH12-05407 n=1 Tax=Blumeria graminis f. sp. triticale TaxID=1689686 RepID=A0A9W4D1X7_BLUGR|nr:BgTH12-05407 [Blumeria graminis f. sp. triticale]